jgi:hypothetical protein
MNELLDPADREELLNPTRRGPLLHPSIAMPRVSFAMVATCALGAILLWGAVALGIGL